MVSHCDWTKLAQIGRASCRESEGKAKIEGYMSVSDEEAHHRFSSGSGTFWLNPNLKYQVWSSGQLNPKPEPLEPGLKGSNSVQTSLNLQLNKPNFSFLYLFSFSIFSWCHTVTEPNWLTYIFTSSQPTLSFHSHSHTTSQVIVFITN